MLGVSWMDRILVPYWYWQEKISDLYRVFFDYWCMKNPKWRIFCNFTVKIGDWQLIDSCCFRFVKVVLLSYLLSRNKFLHKIFYGEAIQETQSQKETVSFCYIQSVTKIHIYLILKYVFFACISGTTWATNKTKNFDLWPRELLQNKWLIQNVNHSVTMVRIKSK